MKKLIALLFILSILSCGNDSKSGHSEDSISREGSYESIDEFGNHIFKLVQADNYDELRGLIVTKADMHQIIDNLIFPKGKTKKEALDAFDEEFDHVEESFNESYLRLRREATSSGIDWKKCKLEFIDFNHTRNHNLESADIDIYFSIYNNINHIKISGCVKGKNSWLLGERIRLIDSEY